MYFNKVRTNHGLLCYTEDTIIDLTVGNKSFSIGKNNLFFLEKNLQVKIKIQNGNCPRVISLNDSAIRQIHDLLLMTVDFSSAIYPYVFPVHTRQASLEDVLIFKKLDPKINYVPESRQSIKMISIITYLLLQFEPEILQTLSRMVKVRIKDKVINIIKSDMTNQWTTCKVSDILCISEITLRKKLDAENEKFLDILTNLRMNQALRLLATTEYSVEKISRDVGYCTTSHFIKVFKSYFGYTPKQIALKKHDGGIENNGILYCIGESYIG